MSVWLKILILIIFALVVSTQSGPIFNTSPDSQPTATSETPVVSEPTATTSILSTEVSAPTETLISTEAIASPTSTLLPTETLVPTQILPPTEALLQTAVIPTSNNLTPLPAATLVVSDFIPCDSSIFVKDVTIPDGTVFAPGKAFEKTWRFENTGTCGWTRDYSMVFVSGSSLGGNTTTIKQFVASGKQANVTVAMSAPKTEGIFEGYWQLANEDGKGFGQVVYVYIQVVIPPEEK